MSTYKYYKLTRASKDLEPKVELVDITAKQFNLDRAKYISIYFLNPYLVIDSLHHEMVWKINTLIRNKTEGREEAIIEIKDLYKKTFLEIKSFFKLESKDISEYFG